MRTGSVKSYRAFTRTWWKRHVGRPGKGVQAIVLRPDREMHPGPKTVLGKRLTYEEAQTLCKTWNAEHKPGVLSRRAEFEAE